MCDSNCEKARVARPAFFSPAASVFGRARLVRRTRVVGRQVLSALAWRQGARALSPGSWAFVCSFLWLAGQSAQLGWLAVPSLVLFVALGVAAAIDARYLILPDGPLVALAASGAVMLTTMSGDDAIGRILAALFAFSAFRAMGWLYEKWRGFPGLGRGDANLFAMAGLWLGWAGLPSALIVACLSAAVAAIIALRDGTQAGVNDPLPFGPHLALGIWLVWVIGPISLI